MRAEVLKGHLDGLLLAALEQGPLHGYGVIEQLRSGSGGRIDLPTGTVYPALHRLERAGWVHSTWSNASGRRRRSYELTTDGTAALDTTRAGWEEFSTAVSALLARRSWSTEIGRLVGCETHLGKAAPGDGGSAARPRRRARHLGPMNQPTVRVPQAGLRLAAPDTTQWFRTPVQSQRRRGVNGMLAAPAHIQFGMPRRGE